MEIKCTPNELKELLKKDVPVVRTTDTINMGIDMDKDALSNYLQSSLQKCHN